MEEGNNEEEEESLLFDAANNRIISNNKKNDTKAAKPERKRHGARNQHKTKYFVRWLMDTFPCVFSTVKASVVAESSTKQSEKQMQKGDESDDDDDDQDDSSFYSRPLILDIAGGKGECAARLCYCDHQRVVLVDPRPADLEQCYMDVIFRGLPKKWQTRLRERQQHNPRLLQEIQQERFRQLTIYFDTETIHKNRQLQTAVEHAELIIGMHADGATEAIVEIAVQFGKPFVVVPCCVFPNFFPNRRIVTTNKNNGQTASRPVRSYDDFCEYLLQKDKRFRKSILPFEGRNVAIWWDGKAAATTAASAAAEASTTTT